ncbi:uncharacterized protein JN550_005478 [Neoarthrinium moseri]|uniref:uncharacterized protein n=1 Tax=Neoarthrinium moseri TaxID=1658444 RepID=UPI001FDB4D29|nr:uncharacterized protein JN550_005478 [Neoarthrinium moseri]KAI1869888.1 hypothetical protein JN550_005478 [Neoarthrinium moseri]
MAEGLVGGGGWHAGEIVQSFGPEVVIRFLKISVAVQIMWTLSLSPCKLSILVLYCKIFTIARFQWTCYITGGVIAAWSLSTILSALLICQPMSDLWSAVPKGHCGDHTLSYTITGSINIVTDVIVLLLPLPYLIHLEMALYKKLVLTATFTVGLFVCVVSALRLHSIRSIDFSDITYTVAEAQIWSALEPALGITVACVPVLRPLFGGQHSPNGTSLESGRKKAHALNRIFESVYESSSEYQLRPYHSKHGVEVTSQRHTNSNSLDGTDCKYIGVLQEWKVDTR